MRAGIAVLVALGTAAVTCKTTGSASQPPAPPSLEEVQSFLSKVAAASADESELRRFFEGGGSYPREDLAFVKSLEFWKLRPASRVKRLGPDAFQVNFLPEQPDQRDGVVTVRMRVTLPVRRGRDGQLRVLSRQETERLAKLPLPEEPEGEVVTLDYPDEGALGRQAGYHYATELQATAQADTVTIGLRFDPPLTGPGLRADVPVTDTLGFGDEIGIEISFDADADPGTGVRLDELYRRAQEAEKGTVFNRPQQIAQWKDFGVDKTLAVQGKKFVQSDGSRAWGLRIVLRNEVPELAPDGGIRFVHDVVLEKALGDAEVRVAGDLLTISVPAGLLPMRAGASYRAMIEQNSGYSRETGARKGRVGTSLAGTASRNSASARQ
jgi:hypothetical protein